MKTFSDLKGETIVEIFGLYKDSERVEFKTKSGKHIIMFHSQDCCEHVSIEDVSGDFNDLLNEEIILAEESTSSFNPDGVKVPDYQDSFTWTFYKLATAKGYVDIRWYSSSNGYYSERVEIHISGDKT